jgi:hypothetical protein
MGVDAMGSDTLDGMTIHLPQEPGTLSATHAQGFLGIIMLDTQFPRPVGDIGNFASFKVPVHHEKIRGVWPAHIVTSAKGLRAQVRLVATFQQIVRHLTLRGAKSITTSCGFLVLLQKELQSATHVPLITSSLCQLPALLQVNSQVGVLTISAASLGSDHLRAAGVPKERIKDVIVQGVDAKSEFATKILGNQLTLDLAQAEKDVVAAALKLKARAPQLTTCVLECTNMPPYQTALEEATGWKFLSLRDEQRLMKPFEATT